MTEEQLKKGNGIIGQIKSIEDKISILMRCDTICFKIDCLSDIAYKERFSYEGKIYDNDFARFCEQQKENHIAFLEAQLEQLQKQFDEL